MNSNDEIKVNPVPIKNAGGYIKKSVIYRIITQTCVLAAILLAILFFIDEFIPALIEQELTNIYYDLLIISMVFMAASIVFWVLSLTTLNKAGLLLKECDNMSIDVNLFKTKNRKKLELDWIPFFSMLIYIIIVRFTPYFSLSHLISLTPKNIAVLFALIGLFLLVKKSKWTFITGAVNILLHFYYVVTHIISSYPIRAYIKDIILITLLSVFVFRTMKYFNDSKIRKKLDNGNT